MASEAREAAAVSEVVSGQAQGRRLAFAILVLGVLCAICAPFFADLIARDAPRAKAGVVSYQGWGGLSKPVELAGEWRMVWHTAPQPGAQKMMPVPGQWEQEPVGAVKLPEQGAASYHLQIRDLPPGRYTLFVPALYAGSRVTLNGQVFSEQGKFGLSPELTRYLVRGHEVYFETDGSDLDLAIDIAQFFHRDNGLQVTPVFGLSEPMGRWITLDWLRSLLLITSLLLLACYGAVVFLFRPKDRASLYFALACLFLLPLIGVFSHDNILMIAFPRISFTTMMAIQYLTSLVALALVLAYTADLFPRETPWRLFWTLQAMIGALGVLYTVLWSRGDTLLMSQISQIALIVRTATFVLMMFIVIRACFRKRDGAIVFLFGMGMFTLTLIYTDLVTNTVIPRFIGVDVLPIGTLVMLFSHIVILAERWSLAINNAEQTNADLRRLLDVNISITSEMQLEALLTKIVQVTSKVIHADRTSLFLYDDRTDELWSVVAEGVKERQLRFPADAGLAGWVFKRGEAVNLANAYADERFNRAVDSETGYKTQSVLTVPVTARDGRRVGVMQALNRQNGPAFGDADVERMAAFAAQAAVAIDNATLFAEVAAERNYNESILRSMSAGVVTLDPDIRAAKLNPAAARILEVPIERLEGADARAWLEATNPGLLAEIDGVGVSGRPKSLLDFDIRTARGRTVSANLSIVPLVGERGAAGLLILVEDITEGKRMQGAMRRFMSQKVVDQVMEHGEDDLLFGTACRASVLFADIRNFTSLAETLQPRETVDMLNEVFTDLVEAVAASDGVLDKFLGDAIMAVYGAPLPSERDALNAVESALAMLQMVDAVNARRRERGRDDLTLGIGIATGDVVAGTIGSLKRMDYTVVGDSVNLASRLQQLTKLYQVGLVVCEETATALKGAAPLRELDTIRVRGRQRPAKLFEVLAREPTPALADYRRGRELMARRRWKEAVEAFEAAIVADPDDQPSALMLDRARILARRPPPADWDGVWVLSDAA